MRFHGNLSSSVSVTAACLFLAAAIAGCSGDDTEVAAPASDAGTIDSTTGEAGMDAVAPPSPEGGGGMPGTGAAKATFSSSSIDFGSVLCGAPPVTRGFSIMGSGPVPLVVSATTVGDGVSVRTLGVELTT